MLEAHSEPNQISKIKVYVTKSIGLKPLTVFVSRSIPDGWVWLGWALNIPLDAIKYKTFFRTICHLPVQNFLNDAQKTLRALFKAAKSSLNK